LVTAPLPSTIERIGAQVIYACGPMEMLRAVGDVARTAGIPAQVAVEESMACGIGVCMTCVLPVVGDDGQTRMLRSCVEGPVFRGDRVRWDDIGTIPTLSIFKRPDGSPMTVPPRRLLAHEIVRFAGEPVAAVVATSRVTAQTAAEAIAVEYEVLPSVVDPLLATRPGAPAVWADAPDNIVAAMSYGDAAAVEA